MALDWVLAHLSPKLKACIPSWREVKSFDPASGQKSWALSLLPKVYLLVLPEKHRVESVLGGFLIREERSGTVEVWVGGEGMNVSCGTEQVFPPEESYFRALTELTWERPYKNSDFFVEKIKPEVVWSWRYHKHFQVSAALSVMMIVMVPLSLINSHNI